MTKTEKLCMMYFHVASIEGMRAENMQREIRGEYMAYTGNDFFYHADDLAKLSKVEEVD